MSDQSEHGREFPAVEDSATADAAPIETDWVELKGPYDEANGRCAAGHPLNGHGRCEPLNDGTGE